MSMVHITNASFRMISKSLRFKKTNLSREELLENISSDFVNDFEDNSLYNNLKTFYNNNELKDFYFIKMVLKDFESLLDEISGNKAIISEFVTKSNSMYAYNVKAPAYHKDSNCQWMKQDFHNIIIPNECRLNQEKYEKATKWINEYKHLAFEELNAKFKIEFECDCDLEEVNRSNSGDLAFDNQEISIKFYSKVKKNFTQMRFFMDGEFADKVGNMKYASSYGLKNTLKNNQNDPYYNTIIDFHTMKETTRSMIINYYKSKYNVDLTFKQTLLDSIGFRQCIGC